MFPASVFPKSVFPGSVFPPADAAPASDTSGSVAWGTKRSNLLIILSNRTAKK
jgi:hypothetical protein